MIRLKSEGSGAKLRDERQVGQSLLAYPSRMLLCGIPPLPANIGEFLPTFCLDLVVLSSMIVGQVLAGAWHGLSTLLDTACCKTARSFMQTTAISSTENVKYHANFPIVVQCLRPLNLSMIV